MNVIEAKNGLRDLGVKAQDIVRDSSLTSAEQMAKLNGLSGERKGYEAVLKHHTDAQRHMAGGSLLGHAEFGG